jgi:hypothetical protein
MDNASHAKTVEISPLANAARQVLSQQKMDAFQILPNSTPKEICLPHFALSTTQFSHTASNAKLATVQLSRSSLTVFQYDFSSIFIL